jgi:cell division protein ZipA
MDVTLVSLMVVIISGTLLLGILGFFLYQKRNQFKQHSYSFGQGQESTGSQSPSFEEVNRFAEYAQGSTPSHWRSRHRASTAASDTDAAYPYGSAAKAEYDEFEVTVLETSAAASTTSSHQESKITSTQNEDVVEDFLVIYVVAEAGKPYFGYELLQALLSAGMRYGDMNIFHRFERSHGRGTPLFSLASASDPGTFDLNHMGEVSCKGLCLFMNLSDCKDSIIAFEKMVDTAQQLVDDLGGELRDSDGKKMDHRSLTTYRERVRDAVVTGDSFADA